MKNDHVRLALVLVATLWFASACAKSASVSKIAAGDSTLQGSTPLEANSKDQNGSAVSSTASAQEAYQGTPVGFTEEGYPYWGDPNAPITLQEYSDYLCPFCSRHFNQTLPALVEKYVSTGQVKFVFRDFPLASLHPTAHIGAAAALCVAEQGAAAFWQMHDELFRTQNEWNQLPDPTEYLAEVAEGIGIDRAVYEKCMASGRTQAQVEQGVTDGQALGFNGTPSFQFIVNESGDTYTLVGAQPMDTFVQWLDALLAGEAPVQEDGQEAADAPELPFWANAEGLAPDPDRPGFTMAGDPYKGNPDAKLAVVEFSDFQCPSCRRHALEAQPILDETFVDSGQIMWVFKHLPLRIHPQSPAASAAAECAADQGRFWDMYHRLFEAQEQWAVDDPDPQLLELAEGLNLDMDLFSACFNGREALERVLSDVLDAQGVAQSTPTFIGIYGGRGAVLRGARTSDEFVSILENMLESAKAQE